MPILKNLIKNTAALTAAQIFTYGLQAGVVVFLIDTIGIESYGIIAICQAFIAISVGVLDLGFSVYAVQKISQGSAHKKYVSYMIGGITAIKFAAYFLFSTLLLLALPHFGLDVKIQSAIGFSLVAVGSICLFPNWFFIGVEKIETLSALNAFGKAIYAALIITFIKSSNDVNKIIAIMGIGNIVVLIMSLFLIRKFGYEVLFPQKIRRYFWTFWLALPFAVSRFALSIISNAGTLMLGSISPPAIVAIYSLVDQVYRFLQTLLGAIPVVLLPAVSKSRDTKFVINFIFVFSIILFLFVVLGYFVSGYAIKYYFGGAVDDILTLTAIFFAILFINSVGVLVGYPLHSAFGVMEKANPSLLYGAAVYFILLMALYIIPVSGVVPFGIALLLTELIIVILRIFSICRSA